MKKSIMYLCCLVFVLFAGCDNSSGSGDGILLEERFDLTPADWDFTTIYAADNTLTVSSGEAYFAIGNVTDGKDISTQYRYSGPEFELKNGETYVISFRSKGSKTLLNFEIQENNRDLNGDSKTFTSYIDEDCTITAEYQTFEFEFTMPLTDDDPMVVFDFGRAPTTGDVYIDDIILSEK